MEVITNHDKAITAYAPNGCTSTADAFYTTPSFTPARSLTNLEREVLFAEFAPLVSRLIRQYGQCPELRQDLRGEIYYRFCTILDRYDPDRGVPLRPYLVRQLSASVYTYARHYWRLQKRETTLENKAEGALHIQDPTVSWIADLTQQEVAAMFPKALAKLPERQRQVVIWRYYEDRSFEEIAARLFIKTATARSLLRHGLNNLRKTMPCAPPL